jgi:hypothetical protein
VTTVVRLNVMNLIVPHDGMNGKMNYVKIIEKGEMGFRGEAKASTAPSFEGAQLEDWATRFCQDESSIKQ